MQFFSLYYADSFKQDVNSFSLNSRNLFVSLMPFNTSYLAGNFRPIHLSIVPQIFFWVPIMQQALG